MDRIFIDEIYKLIYWNIAILTSPLNMKGVNLYLKRKIYFKIIYNFDFREKVILILTIYYKNYIFIDIIIYPMINDNYIKVDFNNLVFIKLY